MIDEDVFTLLITKIIYEGISKMYKFINKVLLEHAELTGKNVMLNWQIEQYESLINDLMTCLCQEGVIGKDYINRYSSLLRIKRGKENG